METLNEHRLMDDYLKRLEAQEINFLKNRPQHEKRELKHLDPERAFKEKWKKVSLFEYLKNEDFFETDIQFEESL